MNRQALRNNYPFHSQPTVSRGFTPPKQPETLGSVLAGIVMYGTMIAAGFAIALPLIRWVLRQA